MVSKEDITELGFDSCGRLGSDLLESVLLSDHRKD